MGEAGGTEHVPWRHPKARFFGAPPRFFAQEQRNGVERAAGGRDFCPGERRTRSRAQMRCCLVFALCVCADTLGGGDGLPCLSTPFLWCLPKETVSSRQRKALFYPGGSTIRVSATSRWTIRSSPDLGRGWWSSERLPSPGANGICYGRFARLVDCAGVTVVISFRSPPKARFFGAPPRFFGQEQRNGVELAAGGRGFCPA